MSFGSLSSAAVRALNRGAGVADCWHNTGEGGIATHHEQGGTLVWQIGTGYFGCRNSDGSFNLSKLIENCERFDVAAIEIKLSQGAKPGLGGVLPSSKINPEISEIRGIPMGHDCISPARHSTFSDADGMLDWVEEIADATGLPVGIKSAVGQSDFFTDLARAMADDGERAVDFIAIDGGEGGTGAAPTAFADHVALPFKVAFPRVHGIFAEHGVADQVFWIGSGRLGFPDQALLAFAMGCDSIAIAREALLSIGCIQALKCHTGHCPTGVATQQPWLVRGLDPDDKAARVANYLHTLQSEITRLCRACGVDHPERITMDHFEVLDGAFGSRPAREVFG